MSALVLPAALADLKEKQHWVLWRYVLKPGASKPTKVPYTPSGRKAESNDPSTWSSYDAVVAAAEGYDGIGFVLTDTEFAALDLDDCRQPESGAVEAWFEELVSRSGSYTEVTPSGTGLRIIGRGVGEKVHRKLRVGVNGASCELYRRATRYITISGAVYRDVPLANIDIVVDATLAELDGNGRDRSRESNSDLRELPPMLSGLLARSKEAADTRAGPNCSSPSLPARCGRASPTQR